MKKYVFLLISGLSLGLFLFICVKLFQFYQTISLPHSSTAVKPEEEKHIYTFLLLGFAGGTHEGTYLTDTMMVGRVDLKKKEVTFVSLPRDLWVKLPTVSGSDFFMKINSVYQMTLFPKQFPDVDLKKEKNNVLIKKIASDVVGFPIDYFLAVDFEAFRRVINIMGGLDIDVKRSFTDVQYPIEGKERDYCGKEEDFKKVEQFLNGGGDATEKENYFRDHPDLEKFFKDLSENPELAFPCRYETVHFDLGLQNMNGEQALKFVRSRHALEDGGDFNRAARQQLVLEALRNKLLSLEVLPKVIPLLEELKGDIRTDFDIGEIQKFIPEVTSGDKYKIEHLVLSDQNHLKSAYSSSGQYILVPHAGQFNWNEIHKVIQMLIEGITPTPSAKPTGKQME